MKRTVLLVVAGLSILLCGCNREIFDNLPVERQPYTGDAIRLDGYYYRDFTEYHDPQNVIRKVIFFFGNGIWLWAGTTVANNTTEIEALEEGFRNETYHTKYDRSAWAAFFVDGDTITTEGWAHNGHNWRKFKLHKDYITIIDRDNIQDSREWIYHFKKFEGKPDSLSRFIP
jgi:hypothetical protein